MLLTLLQAKLHGVTVTHADLHYEGSCGVDTDLLDIAGLRPDQHVEIYNVSNGERLTTYLIAARRGSGEISLNGAAARKAAIGDVLIICGYSIYSEEEARAHRPRIILVDAANHLREVVQKARGDESGGAGT
jgi:aspartate 1-decarboxylase